jgi:hypothetical protein
LLNIRNNARVRVQAYLQQRQHVAYPLITSVNRATGTVRTPFSYQVEAVNRVAGYIATGLPDGLALDQASGVVSGTPATTGIFPVILGAENTYGSSRAELAITIQP